MCLFSGQVRHVAGTQIYASPSPSLSAIHQRLVYEMEVELEGDTAMVLPIPVPPSSPEDAVTFVDMTACPSFFDCLAALWPQPQSGELTRGGGGPIPKPASILRVHDVGDFEASFVPTLPDFARLDERFRLSNEVWSKLPQYADWGFAVFKLRSPKAEEKGLLQRIFNRTPTPQKKRPHPMAFDFPRRTPSELFFPTVHVHDGDVHETAAFDHTFYAQLDHNPPASEPSDFWWKAPASTEGVMPTAKPFVLLDRPVYKKRLAGDHPNRDQLLISKPA